MSKKEKFIIFSVTGGIGKNIAATAVVKGLAKKYPDRKIIVLTAWKEPWMFNKNVYRIYSGQAPYFYETFIENKDTLIFNHDPYNCTDYILQKKHLIPIWFELCGLEYLHEEPELFFNKREIEYVTNSITKGEQFMLVQTNGGTNTNLPYNWVRDIPQATAQEIVNHFAQKMRVIHVRRENQLALENVETFSGGIREIFVLIKLSYKRLFIDSMCQHAAAALNKPSEVLWIGNKPKVLGYTLHTNWQANVLHDLPTEASLFEKYAIDGNIYQCPYSENQSLFVTQSIIHALEY